MAQEFDPELFHFDLPDDPGARFIVFEKMMRDLMDEDKNSENWDAERSYMESMFAFNELFSVDFLEDMPFPPSDGDEFRYYISNWTSRIRAAVVKIRLLNTALAKDQPDRIVIFNRQAKEAIRTLLSAIQKQLDDMQLSDSKKRQLMAKLHAFAAELDQKLTRTEAMFSFAADAAKAVREAGVEFKPLAERIDRVLDMIERAQKWVESIPKWPSGKQLEGPRKQIEGPEVDDEEIPF